MGIHEMSQIISKGKYTGKKFQYVSKYDYSYCGWVLNNNTITNDSPLYHFKKWLIYKLSGPNQFAINNSNDVIAEMDTLKYNMCSLRFELLNAITVQRIALDEGLKNIENMIVHPTPKQTTPTKQIKTKQIKTKQIKTKQIKTQTDYPNIDSDPEWLPNKYDNSASDNSASDNSASDNSASDNSEEEWMSESETD